MSSLCCVCHVQRIPYASPDHLSILYERLAAVPPTPGRHTQELPPEQDPIFHAQPPVPPEHARVIDPNDRELSEYIRNHPTARIIQGPDGRVVAIEDTPANVDARGKFVD